MAAAGTGEQTGASADLRAACADALAGIRLEQDGFWFEDAGDETEGLLGFMCWQQPSKGYRMRDEDWRVAFTAGWNAALREVAKATGATFTSHTMDERTIPEGSVAS